MAVHNDTKSVIFKTAVNLFAEKGAESTSIRDLAAAVGIQSSSIYNHFGSKQALLHSMYEYYEQHFAGSYVDELLRRPVGGVELAYSFAEDIGDLFIKILNIGVEQSKRDPVAAEFVYRNLIDRPKQMYRAAIQELDCPLSPRGVEIAEEIYASLCFGGCIRQLTDRPVNPEMWASINTVLFESVTKMVVQQVKE